MKKTVVGILTSTLIAMIFVGFSSQLPRESGFSPAPNPVPDSVPCDPRGGASCEGYLPIGPIIVKSGLPFVYVERSSVNEITSVNWVNAMLNTIIVAAIAFAIYFGLSKIIVRYENSWN